MDEILPMYDELQGCNDIILIHIQWVLVDKLKV